MQMTEAHKVNSRKALTTNVCIIVITIIIIVLGGNISSL